MTMDDLALILKLAGSTSPLVALLIWHIFSQHKHITKFGEKIEKLTEAWHEVDKRIAIIENSSYIPVRRTDQQRSKERA